MAAAFDAGRADWCGGDKAPPSIGPGLTVWRADFYGRRCWPGGPDRRHPLRGSAPDHRLRTRDFKRVGRENRGLAAPRDRANQDICEPEDPGDDEE